MRVISLHSFKGGVGKTFIALNLASVLAEYGKTCIMELDLIAPSLYSFFEADCYINDLIYGNAEVVECTVEVGRNLYAILASPSSNAIKRELRKEYREEMRTLERLMEVKKRLSGFDFVVLDTHPGISYSSINSIILSDLVLLALRPDKIDVDGTETLLDIIRSLSKPMYAVINRYDGRDVDVGVEVVGTIPCSCDVTMDRPFFVRDHEDHPVTAAIRNLARRVLDL
ncbi:MAG: ParA family protein [Archaeoglobi archaeon]|nr:ParA family protein [Archaeoglobi archaeon]